MGQEQSYSASTTQRRYKEKYDDHYRHSSVEDYDSEYKRHRIRRSGDSFKSDISHISSAESSGYRSGSSSAYDFRSPSERSNSSEYCRLSLYKNDHYKETNKELYKPVKIPKEKRYKLQLVDVDKAESIKSTRLKSYLSDTDKSKLKTPSTSTTKKSGIRNYTPKILSEEEQKKKSENWI